ncbi:MAG: magnesium/cobalt transporter CorA [Candidatus Electrothrix sp. GW3-4]|uniref:magnesium/cobalt transporter CorA n=1 Tax=Candidatus Electrothrix sp. GW3-4 TaxID=3126740 RepID=UPI0030CF260A
MIKSGKKPKEKSRKSRKKIQQFPTYPQKKRNKMKRHPKESLTNPSEKTGLPPGSIVHVGDFCQLETVISKVTYNRDTVEQERIGMPEQLDGFDDNNSVTWITVEGLADVDLIEKIGTMAGIHPLVIEDILTTHQRPKLEIYDSYLFIVTSNLNTFNDEEDGDLVVEHEQISLLILANAVVVFRERTDDLFQPLIRRINMRRGKLRSMGADYLAYALLDILVDQLFLLTDTVDDTITLLEDRLLFSEPTKDMPVTIQQLKREAIFIRKHVVPIKELTGAILRSDSKLIHERTKIYFRDVSDHALRLSEAVESYRELLAGLSSLYISGLSNRMNEVMKVLTLFASVFIPLTFLAGIYGMNFEYMPELHWKWAYPILWALFLAIPAGLFWYFRKKKWL